MAVATAQGCAHFLMTVPACPPASPACLPACSHVCPLACLTSVPTTLLPMPLQNECVAQRAQQPSYRELEGILRGVEWSMSSKPLGERLQYEAAFIKKSLDPLPSEQQLPPGGGQ